MKYTADEQEFDHLRLGFSTSDAKCPIKLVVPPAGITIKDEDGSPLVTDRDKNILSCSNTELLVNCKFDLGTSYAKKWLDRSFTFTVEMRMHSNVADPVINALIDPLSVTRTVTLWINTCDKDTCGECDENTVEPATANPTDVFKRIGANHDKLT